MESPKARRDRAEVSIAQHPDVFLANDRRHNVTDDVHCVLHGADPAFYPASGDGVSVPVCRQVASFVKDSRSLPCGRATYQSRSCTHRGHARCYRLQDRWSSVVAEFAREPGISQGQLSKYEQGSSEIGAAVLLRLAGTSEKTIEWLLTGRDRL
jgi:hypothetical protein